MRWPVGRTTRRGLPSIAFCVSVTVRKKMQRWPQHWSDHLRDRWPSYLLHISSLQGNRLNERRRPWRVVNENAPKRLFFVLPLCFFAVAFGRLFLARSITVPIRSCEDVPTSPHCHREFIHSYFYLRVVSGLFCFFYFIPVSISLGNRQAALDNSFINMLMSFRQVNRSSTTLSTEFSDVCGSLWSSHTL